MAVMGRGEEHGQYLSDRELIRKCSDGDIRAQEMLYKKYFSFAMSVCIRYTGDENEAMETVNDSFMKVFDNLGEYDVTRPFSAWYGKILVNTAIDNYRKNARYFPELSIEKIAETEDHEPEVDAELSAADIIALFSQLPEHYRIIFNLYEIEGYSHDEIAGMLGISASTSRANLARAKKMLRELYIKNHISVRHGNEAV